MSQLDPKLLSRLRHLDQRRRAVQLVAGAASTVLVFLAAVAIFCLLDWCFQLPFVVRAIVTAALYLGVAWQAWRGWLREWLKPFSPEDAAWRIESKCPELREELISAVDFSRNLDKRGSKVLVNHVLDQAKIDVDKLQDTATFPIRWRELRWPLALLLGFVVAMAIPQLQLSQLLGRTLVPASDDATVGLVNIAVVEPGTAVAVENNDVEITARHSGKELADLRLVLAGASTSYVPMTYDFETGLYVGKVEKVHESLKYWVESGRIRSASYRLTVVPLPRVEQIEVAYAYPDYSGRSGKAEVGTTADLRGLIGTVATVTIRGNKPLANGKLAIVPDDNGLPRMNLTGDSGADPSELRFVVPLRDTATFTIELVDVDGLSPILSPEYRISVLPDLPPEVELLAPAQDRAASPKAELEIAWLATDDFGIARLELAIAINQRPEAPRLLSAADAAASLNLARYALTSGDVVDLSIVAFDAAGQSASSQSRRLSILRDAEHDPRPDRFFAAADALNSHLELAAASLPQLAAIHDELASIINLDGLDRAHYEARYSDHLERLDEYLENARSAAKAMAAAAFFPRARNYAVLLERYFAQEQLASIVRLQATTDAKAIAALKELPALALALTHEANVKGRQSQLLSATTRAVEESQILARHLPASKPRLQNLATRLHGIARAIPDAPDALLAELPTDAGQPAAVAALRTAAKPIFTDYTAVELAAQAIRDRLQHLSEHLEKLADRATIHRRPEDQLTLTKMTEKLQREAKDAATPQERLDAKALAETIADRIKDDETGKLAKTAAAVEALERQEELLAAEPEIRERLEDAQTAVAAAKAATADGKAPEAAAQLDALEQAQAHLEAAALATNKEDAGNLNAKAKEARELLDQAKAATQANNLPETSRKLDQVEALLTEVNTRLDRALDKNETNARQARKELADTAVAKADQATAAADAARQQAADEPTTTDAAAKPSAQDQIAALRRQLQDEAAVQPGPDNAPGGAREKDALAAALKDVEQAVAEATRSTDLNAAADQLDQLADLLAKHDAAADREVSLATAQANQAEILDKTGAKPGQKNHEAVTAAALDRAAERADDLARQAAQAKTSTAVQQVAEQARQLQDDLNRLQPDNAPATEATQKTQQQARQSAEHARQIIEELVNAERQLAEADTREQRREAIAADLADEQTAARRTLEEAIERRLPNDLHNELERRRKDFRDHPDNPEHQANILRDAANRLNEQLPEAAAALKEHAEALKQKQQDARQANDDANRAKQLADNASDRAKRANRIMQREVDEEVGNWAAQATEALDDNLAANNIEAARKNLEALHETFQDTAKADAPATPNQAALANAAEALDKAIAAANDAAKPQLQEAAEALAQGDLEAARAAAAEFAEQRGEELALQEAIADGQAQRQTAEQLRQAENSAKNGKLAAAAFAARQAGEEALADQLAAAHEATEGAIEQAHDAATQADDRGQEDNLRNAANDLANNNYDGAERRVATPQADQQTRDAVAAANEARQAAQTAATEAAQQAANNSALEAAKTAAREAAAALRAEAAENTQAANQLAKGAGEEAKQMRAAAQAAQKRAENLEALASQANSDREPYAAKRNEAHAAAQDAAEQLAAAMTAQPAPGETAGPDGAPATASTPPAGEAPTGEAPAGATPAAGTPEGAPPSSAPPAGAPATAATPAAGAPEGAAQPSQPGQTPYANALEAAGQQLAEAQNALAGTTPSSAAPSLQQAAAELSQAAQQAAAASSASAEPGQAQASTQPGQPGAPSLGAPAPGAPPSQAPAATPGTPGTPGDSGSNPSDETSAAIGATQDAASVADHTWSKLWKDNSQSLSGESTQGASNQYGDYYRKANQQYLSKLAAESRRRQLSNSRQK